MSQRFIPATGNFAQENMKAPAVNALMTRNALNRFLRTMHHMLMALGIAAIAAWAVMFFNPQLADHLKALSPFHAISSNEPEAPAGATDMDGLPVATSTAAPTGAAHITALNAIHLPAGSAADTTHPGRAAAKTPEQQWVTNWLSKRYRVAKDATDMLVSAAYTTAREMKLDPLLILAVMAIESGFNPFAESPMGAQGLMQVMSKVHHDKFRDHGGVKAALNPTANIKVGSQILKEYVKRGGSVEAGLKMYVGAAAFDTDYGYGSRVMAEYRRLKDVSAGKKVSVYATTAIAPKPQSPAAQPKRESPALTLDQPLQENAPQMEKATDQIAAL